MIQAETLFRGRSVTLRQVVCRHGRGGPGEEEWSDEPGIGFPCAGVFRRHLRRQEVLADAGTAVFFRRDEPYRISHPVEGGDATTVLGFSRRAVEEAGGFPAESLPVSSPTFALVQRLRRLAQDRAGRELEIEESALAVLDAAARAGSAPSAPPRWSRRADAVREVLAARLGERVTLDLLAREVAVSPFHLARGFRQATGVPIHRYLNRLRLRLALARLSGTGGDLLAVALDCGFSSHAHFTDAFRAEFGAPPSRLRPAPSPRELREMRKKLEAAPGS
ncbi:MAG TPA: AraC family transcriptional regulator [Candidatus Polarisedimenticolaceae bacterium]|nr:AraC family transcriptional regulator [Candidatus Polarisedimenticolaceae bacterium]